eukprot:GHVS01074395.1.p1 GENE.GHVS01074395.1~~GHVS01074395.1.p1  ORF type:complete len:170 (+),score=23.20 GHVS01074395.1:469-978(+)
MKRILSSPYALLPFLCGASYKPFFNRPILSSPDEGCGGVATAAPCGSRRHHIQRFHEAMVASSLFTSQFHPIHARGHFIQRAHRRPSLRHSLSSTAADDGDALLPSEGTGIDAHSDELGWISRCDVVDEGPLLLPPAKVPLRASPLLVTKYRQYLHNLKKKLHVNRASD